MEVGNMYSGSNKVDEQNVINYKVLNNEFMENVKAVAMTSDNENMQF